MAGRRIAAAAAAEIVQGEGTAGAAHMQHAEEHHKGLDCHTAAAGREPEAGAGSGVGGSCTPGCTELAGGSLHKPQGVAAGTRQQHRQEERIAAGVAADSMEDAEMQRLAEGVQGDRVGHREQAGGAVGSPEDSSGVGCMAEHIGHLGG